MMVRSATGSLAIRPSGQGGDRGEKGMAHVGNLVVGESGRPPVGLPGEVMRPAPNRRQWAVGSRQWAGIELRPPVGLPGGVMRPAPNGDRGEKEFCETNPTRSLQG